MRVHISSTGDIANAVAGLLTRAGFKLSTWLPLVRLEVDADAEIDQIVIDGTGGLLETCIVWGISELAKQHNYTDDIALRRAGGVVHDDRRLKILIPDDDRVQGIVEYGIVRGMARYRKETGQ